MALDIEPAELVQGLNNKRGHWLTISTIGTTHPNVHVYDSGYLTAMKHRLLHCYIHNAQLSDFSSWACSYRLVVTTVACLH